MATKNAALLAHAAPAHSQTGAPAVPAVCANGVVTAVRLPAGVQRRLDTLPADLLKAVSVGAAGNVVPAYDALLQAAAAYYFTSSGKMIRPKMLLTLAHLCNGSHPSADVLQSQYTLCCVSEMIHGASLLHDDVLDEADSRRSRPSAHKVFGTKAAILSGDYVLARATKLLCTIGDIEVIGMVSQVLQDLVTGELQQLTATGTETAAADNELSDAMFEHMFEEYLLKTFRKTGSLFAHCARAVAHLSIASGQNASGGDAYGSAAFDFGRHVGIAFQLVDDVLDVVGTGQQAGKPTGVDMHLGLVTAPTLFAMRHSPALRQLAARRFGEPGDAGRAMQLVLAGDGVQRTRRLAEHHCAEAVRCAEVLAEGKGDAADESMAAVRQLLDTILRRDK